MKKTDETSINPNHLDYRWTVEVKGGGGIKGKRENKKGNQRGDRKNTVVIHNQTCNTF